MAEQESWSGSEFLNVAGAFQAGMVLVALGVAGALDIDVWDRVAFTPAALGWGLLGILPLCLISWLMDHISWEPFQRMEQAWTSVLGPALRDLSYTKLVTLALLVGVSEELLFRGVLQVSLLSWGWWPAMIATSIAFGLAHAITPTYAICAGLIGAYLSAMMELTSPPNLIIPILCHAGCDLYAFVQIKREQLTKASGGT
ncbi:MAG TPA: CPBP family intramembrane glutamic endopeptidase [Planctomycetaceae bacterium]|nr:CPBP family intramembrane glutamic endopeptidase [Planctomycetaceae bacterium]